LTVASGAALTGNALNNNLTGNSGNDTLDGGAGADTMAGGAGNDTYYVDSLSDVIIENANEGIDSVNVAISGYTLAANVENATIIGTAGASTPAGSTLAGSPADSEFGGDDSRETRHHTSVPHPEQLPVALGATQPIAPGAGGSVTGNALDNVLTGNSGN